MTGNGKHTTYVWWFGGLFEWYKHGLPTLLYLTLHTLFEKHMVYYLSYCFTPIIPISRMLTDMATTQFLGTRATSWWGSSVWNLSSRFLMKAHDQWEISRIRLNGGTVYVPYVWPYELWGYSLKLRPEKWKRPYIWNRYLQFRFLKWPLIWVWYIVIYPWWMGWTSIWMWVKTYDIYDTYDTIYPPDTLR
jgi:hypothetical protein